MAAFAASSAALGTLLVLLRVFTAGGSTLGGFSYLADKEPGEKPPDLGPGGGTPGGA